VVEEGWFDQVLPEVRIPGTAEPERFVLLHGHYDSWDVGVGDNATGDACMLEVARLL
jgi:N-acetylated-alpha-linked acidic dipeptidase